MTIQTKKNYVRYIRGFPYTVETAYNRSARTEYFHPLYAISGIGDVVFYYSRRLRQQSVSVIADIRYEQIRYSRYTL